MTIACANKASAAQTGTTTGSVTSPSVAFVSGNYYIVTFVRNVGDVTAVATVAGITWTSLASTAASGSNQGFHTYGGLASSTTTTTFTFTASSWNGQLCVDEFTGMASSNTIVQNASHRSVTAGDTPNSVTLSAFAGATNATYAIGCGFSAAASTPLTAKSGFTAVKNINDNTNQVYFISEFKSSNDTTPNIGLTGDWTSGGNTIIWAAEIAIVVAASTNNVTIIMCGV